MILETYTAAYSEPCQITKMKRFVKIINGVQLLEIFVKSSILDVWLDFEYASVQHWNHSWKIY